MLDTLLDERNKINSNKGLNRVLYPLSRHDDNHIEIDSRKLINFTSNDYLGIAKHQRVKKSFSEAAMIYGMGSSASALVSGYSKHHQMLEEQFAEFVNYEQAILFNSGYHANIGLMTALGALNPTIIMDKLCHASIIDGVKLSGSKFHRYAHNNMNKLETFLVKDSLNKLVISESIHSMEGDIAPIDQMAILAKKYHASLIIDDAHAIGVLGANGRGSVEHYNLTNKDVSCLVMPLGKAFGGCGAIVGASASIIDYLRQFARSYIYSTSLPPAIACASLEALKIIKEEGYRREKLNELIIFFNEYARELGLLVVSADITPIRSIIINCNIKLIEIRDKAMSQGYFISAIRPPTVPKGKSRLRISLNFMHKKSEIKTLLQLIAREYEK
jgi:8-amino-7-oxononanoate synthase